ncbi:MAG: phosphatidylserine decarboxylase [Opitutales bacterium]|nr:phosphatidylserine decarboxylase [Opitutales bacterium]
MKSEPVQFYNRYTGRIETEAIYGEKWLRWAYETKLGRLSLPALVARPWFSRWYGYWMSRPASTRNIVPFIEKYQLEPSEWETPGGGFRSFNDFFTRRLKPEARPLAEDPDAVVFPADGRHLGFTNAEDISGVFVKGQRWDLVQLLGDETEAERIREGVLVLSRLCPVDYHHFHFAAEGVPKAAYELFGPLYSVNPIALRRELAYLWRNYRRVTPIEHPRIGRYYQIEIGATNVGSIQSAFKPDVSVEKGAHKGWFEFGGSSTITIFPKGSVELAADLLDHSCVFTEIYAHMGDQMGVMV